MKRAVSYIIIIQLIFSIFCFPVYAAPGEINIVSPGSVVTCDIDTFEVSCTPAAEKIIYELDGKIIDDNDSDMETLVLADSSVNLAAGNHILKVSAVFPDGTAAVKEHKFNVSTIYERNYTENFNSYLTVDKTAMNIGFSNKNVSDLTLANGKDYSAETNTNDKSLKWYYTSDNKVSSGQPSLELKNFTNFSAGKTKFKFDMKSDDYQNLRLNIGYMRLWTEKLNFTEASKFYGTSAALSDGWMTVEIEDDYTNGNVVFKVDGQTLYNGVIKENSYTLGSNFYLAMYQTTARTSDTRTNVYIDNVDFSQTVNVSLDKISYSVDSGASYVEYTNYIPSNARTIKLDLSEVLFSDEYKKVQLYENGVLIEGITTEYNDTSKSVIITSPRDFVKGANIVAKLPETTCVIGTFASASKASLVGPEFGVPLEARLNVEKAVSKIGNVTLTKANSSIGNTNLITSSQIRNGDVINAEITLNNTDTESKKMCAILSLRQNGGLVTMDAAEVNISGQGSETINLELSSIADIDQSKNLCIKILLCDGIGTTFPISDLIEIN